MGTQSARRKASTGTTAETVSQPPIWTKGRQQPRFDLAAFARVATFLTKRDLPPVIDAVATRLAAFGARVHSGDLRITARWAQNVLPSHQRVGRSILALQRCLRAAHALIAPPAPVAEPLAYPGLGRRADRPTPGEQTFVEPTLHAIRSAIALTPHDAAPERRNPNVRPRPEGAVPTGWIQSALAHVLLALLLLLAWPVGAVKALLHHLNGGDLRDWS